MSTSQHNFGMHTPANEVIEKLGTNLTGYETVVTGASSGIGVETARTLAKAGARVVLAVRDVTRGEQVAADIRASTGNDKVEVEKLELDSLASVDAFVQRYIAKQRPLHILINNAGIMACPLTYTVDGFESQFGTNHMGHFALTIGLLEPLKQAAKASGRNSRVVNLSSMAHIMSDVVFEDINYKKREYVPFGAYGQSKTANVLFSIALTKHFAKDGILSNAVMPGGIKTNLGRSMTKEELIRMGVLDKDGNAIPDDRYKTVEAGASTSIWAAVAPELENVGGKYLENCTFGQPSTAEDAYKAFAGYLGHIYNEENAEKLWQLSHEWLKNPPK